MIVSAPKIFAAVLVVLAAPHHTRGSEERFSCGQRSHHYWPKSRSVHGIYTHPQRLLNSLLKDPWLDHYDIWHDPFGWNHMMPWRASHYSWKTGLSFLGPPMSRTNGIGVPALTASLCSHMCQEENDKPLKTGADDGRLQRDDDTGSPRTWQKADDLHWQDEFQREKRNNQREAEQQQRRNQQRLQQEKQKSLREEAERNRHWEEHEMLEKRRTMQRDQEIERERQGQYKEGRARKGAAESQILQGEWERQREQDASDAGRQYMDRHPRKEMKTSRKNRRRDDHQSSGHGFRKAQIGTLKIPGYTSEHLSVTASDDKLLVRGRNICGCQEDCTEREFQRSFELPRNVDPASLEARLDEHKGQLTITGNQFANALFPPLGNLAVRVEGHGSRLKLPRNVDSTCGGRRTGIKLRKMNKRTGEIVEDLQDPSMSGYVTTFEDEVDEDGVTMEVVDY